MSEPVTRYAKRIQRGREEITAKHATAWDIAIVEFADALEKANQRIEELECRLRLAEMIYDHDIKAAAEGGGDG